MSNSLYDLTFMFCIFSIIGWIVEVLYDSVQNKRMVNRGFLMGPYLTVYGTGALMGIFLIGQIQHFNIFIKAVSYLGITTITEYAAGLILLKAFNVKLWDYSNEKFNYNGIICLKFSLFWMLSVFFFDYLMFDRFNTFLISLPSDIKIILSFVVIPVMAFDFIIVFFRNITKVNPEYKADMEREFAEIARNIISNPQILRLREIAHHRNTSRFDHVMEVAWLSFVTAKRFKLDISAVVRGALLHDLFYYDWMNPEEAPRWHAFVHPYIALRNAKKFYSLSQKEEDIIKKHMWPLTVIPPFHAESLIVAIADTYCGAKDYILSVRPVKFIMGKITVFIGRII